MKFTELPQETQERLRIERLELARRKRNTPYEVLIYNADGTRYFQANRCCKAWGDDKGHYMPFGGGTYWVLRYGAVQFQSYRNPFGERDYELCEGKTYGKSANGTSIPSKVETKKEVMEIAKAIGIFNI